MRGVFLGADVGAAGEDPAGIPAEGQAGSRWERCPGTAAPATSEPSSGEALLGCRELLRGGKVQTGVSGSFLLPVLEFVT